MDGLEKMTITTHVIDRDFSCAHCGMDLTGLRIATADYEKMKRGDRIGVITGLRHALDSAYLIQRPEFDTNKFCAPMLGSTP